MYAAVKIQFTDSTVFAVIKKCIHCDIGYSGSWYNIISAPFLQVNAFFKFLHYRNHKTRKLTRHNNKKNKKGQQLSKSLTSHYTTPFSHTGQYLVIIYAPFNQIALHHFNVYMPYLETPKSQQFIIWSLCLRVLSMYIMYVFLYAHPD